MLSILFRGGFNGHFREDIRRKNQNDLFLRTRPRPAFGRLGLGSPSGGYGSHGQISHALLTNSLPDRCRPKLLPTSCQKGAVQKCYQQLAKKVRSKTVTSSLPVRFGPKLLLTACPKGAFPNCYQQLARQVRSKTVTNTGRRMTFQMFRFIAYFPRKRRVNLKNAGRRMTFQMFRFIAQIPIKRRVNLKIYLFSGRPY